MKEVMMEDRYDIRVLTALRRIIRAIDLHSKKLMSEHGITGPQLICLYCISENEPITATGISKQIHLSSSTLIGILDRLKDRGLIHRERDLNDRRHVNVTLSDKGRQLISSAPSPLQDALASSLFSLPELEQATIALSLERVVDLMEAQKIDASPILETGKIGTPQDSGIKPLKKVK